MGYLPKVKATIWDKRGRVLAVSLNSFTKTHPWQRKLAKRVGGNEDKIYLHAEVACIIKALKVGTPYSIHVERYLKNGTTANARPCIICMEAIRVSGIKKITWTE